MIKKLMAKTKELGVRIVESDNQFIEDNIIDIEEMLYYHCITTEMLKIGISKGLKYIKFEKKNDPCVNYREDNLVFMYAFHNWFMLADYTNNRLLLWKVE